MKITNFWQWAYEHWFLAFILFFFCMIYVNHILALLIKAISVISNNRVARLVIKSRELSVCESQEVNDEK